MIVVTGATGHIGNVLIRELLAKRERVRAVIPPFEDGTPIEGLEIEKVEGDVRGVDSLIQAFRGADAVYHLAGIISILPGKTKLLYQVNVMGTRNVVEACLKSHVRRLIYTSSIHAMAEPPHGTVINETMPFAPDRAIGEYGKSKAQASLGILEGVEKGLDAVLVCPTGVIGPYDFKLSEMGQLFIDFAKGKLNTCVDGAYDFVDVRDVVRGLILALEKGGTGESYILSGERITVAKLMSTLEEVTGVKAPHFKTPMWLAKVMAIFTSLYYRLTNTKPRFTKDSLRILRSNSFISSEKASHQLGYSHRPIRETIVDTIQWFEETGRL